MTRRERLGVVGCGAVTELFYAQALAGLRRRFDLVFIDSSLDRAKALAAQAGGTAHASLDDAPGLDLAIVATPPASHHALVRRLLDGGTDVLCEKPLVLARADADDLVARARTQGRVLAVNQTRRHFAASRLARRLLAEGAVGDLTHVYVQEGNRFNWPSRSAFYFDTKARMNGVLSDRGSHIFDLVLWLTGLSLRPTATVTDGPHGPEATACVDFAGDGVSGSCLMTWLLDIPTRLAFTGTTGTLLLDRSWNRVVLERPGARPKALWGTPRASALATFAPIVLRDFVQAREGHPSVADAASVVPGIGFLEQAYAQARPEWPSVAAAPEAW